jgi:membrane protein implicated in regulation of membrane protease activity
MRWLLAFVRFWYEFIVGDDWLIAVGIIAAIALTALIAHNGIAAWWAMPLAVLALLGGSLRRALRKAREEGQQP